MRIHRLSGLVLSSLAAATVATPILGQPIKEHPRSSKHCVLVCPLVHAKAMPAKLPVNGMRFTGPAGHGRGGSAGFVVQSRDLVKHAGTAWQFVFQRDPGGYGFQVIHPFQRGHIVVSVGSRLTIHRGGWWGDIGWGNPENGEDTKLTLAAEEMLPIAVNVPHEIVSQLSAEGEYRLWVDQTLICRHTIESALPLHLEIRDHERVWAGSRSDRSTFHGEKFRPQLKPGQAGLILAPTEDSGRNHFLKDVRLLGLQDLQSLARSRQIAHLLDDIEELRNAKQIRYAKSAGGRRGGPFEILPKEPSVLIGFHYTVSRHYVGHLTIKAIRPIFRNHDGESAGEWSGRPHGQVHTVKAKDGYVVAGIVAKTGNRVDGMRVIYMKAKNGRLNPDDTYRSRWIGGLRGSPETLYATDGHPIIGIYGTRGNDVDAFGFIQADATQDPRRKL